MKIKLKAHLFTLPRWFAIPFFGSSIMIGSILAGSSFNNLNLWLGLVAGLLIMAGGHSFNSFLDYAWTGLDKGEVEERSAEKGYTGGQNLIAAGILNLNEVFLNAIAWYALALIPVVYLAVNVGWPIVLVAVLGMLITFWYSWGKFNWTHELALGVGVGPLAVLVGMFAVTPTPPWVVGIIVSFPIATLLSFSGLALDEWPDAEANLKKGVKSIAYKVWEYGVDLGTYLTLWVLLMYVYQVFLISIGFLAPLTGLTFIVFPPLLASVVLLKGNFEKFASKYVLIGAFYPILLAVGQALGD